MRLWLVEEVVPRTRPRTVVYGLSSLDLMLEATPQIQAYESARQTRKGATASFDRFASRYSALVKYRRTLSNPGSYGTIFKSIRRSDEPVAAPAIEENGQWVRPSEESLDALADAEKAVIGTFSYRPSSAAAVEEIVSELKRRNISVVLVDMPVPSTYIRFHPGGRAQYRDAQRRLARIAQKHGIPMIDMTRGFDDSMFSDHSHLSLEGAELFTKNLALELSRLNG